MVLLGHFINRTHSLVMALHQVSSYWDSSDWSPAALCDKCVEMTFHPLEDLDISESKRKALRGQIGSIYKSKGPFYVHFHHSSLDELNKSAIKGCRICQRIAGVIEGNKWEESKGSDETIYIACNNGNPPLHDANKPISSLQVYWSTRSYTCYIARDGMESR